MAVPQPGRVVRTFLKNPWLAEILGFLIIFFAIVLLFGIAARIARWIMKEAGLSGFDRFLGGVLGLVKGGLMVAVILMGMTAFAADFEAAGGFAIGALLSGGRTGGHLAGACGFAGPILPGTGSYPSGAAEVDWHS